VTTPVTTSRKTPCHDPRPAHPRHADEGRNQPMTILRPPGRQPPHAETVRNARNSRRPPDQALDAEVPAPPASSIAGARPERPSMTAHHRRSRHRRPARTRRTQRRLGRPQHRNRLLGRPRPSGACPRLAPLTLGVEPLELQHACLQHPQPAQRSSTPESGGTPALRSNCP
jgi:hypothetical protein